MEQGTLIIKKSASVGISEINVLNKIKNGELKENNTPFFNGYKPTIYFNTDKKLGDFIGRK